jgi:hypothetical protein
MRKSWQQCRVRISRVRCDRYRAGFFRLATYDSLKGKLPAIEFPSTVEQHHDLVLVGGPLSVGRPALPIRAFLAMRKSPVRQNGSVPHPHRFTTPPGVGGDRSALGGAGSRQLGVKSQGHLRQPACRRASPVRAQLADEKATA